MRKRSGGSWRRASPSSVWSAGRGTVLASNAADDDAQLSGESRDKAVAAARAHVGEGEVTDTEVGDDGAAYGVEILKPDGAQLEVHLDKDYKVTGTEADDDSGPDDDAGEPDDD